MCLCVLFVIAWSCLFYVRDVVSGCVSYIYIYVKSCLCVFVLWCVMLYGICVLCVFVVFVSVQCLMCLCVLKLCVSL